MHLRGVMVLVGTSQSVFEREKIREHSSHAGPAPSESVRTQKLIYAARRFPPLPGLSRNWTTKGEDRHVPPSLWAVSRNRHRGPLGRRLFWICIELLTRWTSRISRLAPNCRARGGSRRISQSFQTCYAKSPKGSLNTKRRMVRDGRMREIILIGIAMTVMLASIVAWATHVILLSAPLTGLNSFPPRGETPRICPLRSGSTLICGQITQRR